MSFIIGNIISFFIGASTFPLFISLVVLYNDSASAQKYFKTILKGLWLSLGNLIPVILFRLRNALHINKRTSHPILDHVVLSYCSRSFRYYLKILLIGVWLLLGCLLFIPFLLLRPRNVLNMSITLKWGKPLFKMLGIEWIVTGQENLPGTNVSSIVIYNHQSFLDMLAFSVMCLNFKKATGLMKKELLYYSPLGLLLWLCGALFIDRAKGKESQDYLNSQMKRLQKEETSLFMAPEGTRSKKDTIQPFKTGAFRLAVAHRAPIVPVVISPYRLLNHEHRIFNSGKIWISFLPAIQTKDMENTKEVVEELKNCTWKLMNDEYTQMQRNIEKHLGVTHRRNIALVMV